MQMNHYNDFILVSEMSYFKTGYFDPGVVLRQPNRGINHLLYGSQTLFAYTELHYENGQLRILAEIGPFSPAVDFIKM